MVKHLIFWKLKEEYSDAERRNIMEGIRNGLEGLQGKIPGLLDIHVRLDKLPSSSADCMLDTTFESAEALRAYSVHPAHVAVANANVRPFVSVRLSMDYKVDETAEG